MGWWQETYEELGGITAEEWLRREYPRGNNAKLAKELSQLLKRAVTYKIVVSKAYTLQIKKAPDFERSAHFSWWNKPAKELGGLTAEEWLQREYANQGNLELAKELSQLLGHNISPSALNSRARRLHLHKDAEHIRRNVEEFAKGRRYAPLIILPDFIDYENVSGTATISGDFHIPLHDPKLIEKMVYVSQKMNSKKLIVAGDFYNLDAFSKFVSEPTYFAGEELDYGEQILDYLVEWFDSILLLMGNHEERLYKRRLDKEIDIERLNRMLHRHEDKIKFSKYGYCVLNDTWRITHPKNYSQIKTRVANRLALKHRQHVLNFHGHALSIAHDDSGHQIIADGGGLFDEKKMEYRMIKDSIYPAWARGFWVITNNNELHAFNDLFTPWAFYEKAWANEKNPRTTTKREKI